jgi:N-acetylglucosamine-6-phosphate deacetylase
MAARYPAQAIGDGARGVIENGAQADLVHLSDDLAVRRTIIAGVTVWAA